MARPKPNLTEQELKARQARWVKEWRERNPEKQKLARKRTYNSRKANAMSKVAEPVCNKCGCDELDFLEFNHIGGGGCQDWKESKNKAMADRILTGRSVDDLEILCRLCNALDHLSRKNKTESLKFNVSWNKAT
jgi:hypothetical protein